MVTHDKRLILRVGSRGKALLLHKHDLCDNAQQRAALLTTIGGVRDRSGAPPGEVADAFRQAIEQDPLHVPAIDALSALHLRQGNTQSAQRLLDPRTLYSDG